MVSPSPQQKRARTTTLGHDRRWLPPKAVAVIVLLLTAAASAAVGSAMADPDSGFNEDSAFGEYNPHPYQGGYDIALTYGQPLPPSTATCYPLSDAPPPPTPRLPEPADELTPIPVPHGGGDGFPEPDRRPTYDSGGPGFDNQNPTPEPYSSDLLGCWPFLDEERSLWRDGSEEPGYWKQWRRAADYLFGYSHGYGERRVGTDSYGIPIYAYRRQIDQPLVVQIEPARSHKPDYFDAHREQVYPIHSEAWPSTLSERRDDKDYYENSLHVEVDQIEPSWYQKPSHGEVYEEQVDPLPKWSSSSYGERVDEIHSFGTPNYAYDRHYYEEPLRVQLETGESAFSHEPSHYNVYQEHASIETNWHSSFNDEPLEPFKPTWSRNPSHYGVYNEEPSPESKWHSSSSGETLEPFESSWSRNPNYYGVYGEELSPESKWGDDPYEDITAQFFCPIQKYSGYNE